MAVNTKTEYALRILIELAGGGRMSAQKICEAQKLPKKYIEHLMALLKSAHIVQSTTGSKGGYSLTRAPKDISFAHVLAAVEDNSFDASCEVGSARFCLGEECKLTYFFQALNDKILAVLEAYTLADILKIWNKG